MMIGRCERTSTGGLLFMDAVYHTDSDAGIANSYQRIVFFYLHNAMDYTATWQLKSQYSDEYL